MSSQQPFNTLGSGPANPSVPLLGGVNQATPNVCPALVGEVQHIQFLSDHIGALFLHDEYSDVTLIVAGQRFFAHRVILAARSEYFRALLYGGMRESQLAEIELKDTPLSAFKFLLKYIYTGQMTLSNLKDNLILEILGLAHQYGFQDLESSISEYLRAILNIRNVCFIYDTAALYQLSELTASCCLYMDRHAVEIIKHESFKTLSTSGVRDVISRDSFCAPEVDIFRAVHDWVRANPSEDPEPILSSVRLSLMVTQDLLKVVRPTGLVPPDVMLDAIQSRTESRDTDLKYRGYLMPEENVAQPKLGAQVLLGEVKQALLDGDSKNYDMERGFSRHPIDESQDKGIVVRLGVPCIINHIKMLLWDRDQRAYSYYIDVSMDQQDWVRVVDYSRYHCRSWQYLYFPDRVVRYIRIVGTHNTVNKVFHVVTLEAYNTKEGVPKLDAHGIVIPRQNVATIPLSACVTEGVCRSRNALLNGDTSNYDWDSGYTCHQLGSGAIVVQLGQPYAIESMRLLLWDCDDRSYSYYVEVSVNDRDWEVVCDRSRENCKSWQTINFPRRPIVYVKIVGTQNTANEVFHCVHFECPSVSSLSQETVIPCSPIAASAAISHSSDDSEEDASSDTSEISGARANKDDAGEGASPRSSKMNWNSYQGSPPASFSSDGSVPRRQHNQSQWPVGEASAMGGQFPDEASAAAASAAAAAFFEEDHFRLSPAVPRGSVRDPDQDQSTSEGRRRIQRALAGAEGRNKKDRSPLL